MKVRVMKNNPMSLNCVPKVGFWCYKTKAGDTLDSISNYTLIAK